MSRKRRHMGDQLDERCSGIAQESNVVAHGIASIEERGDAAPPADPVDAIVGSLDVEPATIDDVVYPPIAG